MKWNGIGRGTKALGVSLAVGLGMTACSRDYTLAYVYVTAATASTSGLVNEYAVDYQTGALTPLAETSISSGGANPAALVPSPNGQNLYVINNGQSSSNVVQFQIGTDGKLYGAVTTPLVQNTDASIVGAHPTALAIDSTGTFLFVTFTYQNGYTEANPGPGGVAVYPISSSGALGAPLMNGTLPYFPVGDNPVGLVVSPNTTSGKFLYVIDQEKPTGANPYGVVLTFSVGSTGALTAVPATGMNAVAGGIQAGTQPAGIAEDPGSHYIYITDSLTNQLYGYGIQASGLPAAIHQSPFTTGSFPEGVTVDPRGLFVYVANYNSGTVSAYAIGQSSGALTGIASSSTASVQTGPTCVAIEPALGIYLFTSNNEDNDVSALQLSPNTGALTQVQNTPYPSAALPTCVAAVANGAHATELVQ